MAILTENDIEFVSRVRRVDLHRRFATGVHGKTRWAVVGLRKISVGSDAKNSQGAGAGIGQRGGLQGAALSDQGRGEGQRRGREHRVARADTGAVQVERLGSAGVAQHLNQR